MTDWCGGGWGPNLPGLGLGGAAVVVVVGGTLGLGGAAVAGIGRGGGGGVPYSVMGMAGMVVVGGVYRGAVLGGAGVRH